MTGTTDQYGGTAVWFGPAERPLAGRLHLPDTGLTRGAVVLCPPIGYEYVLAHRTFLRLAQACAAAGIAALRLDYDGIGSSWGDDEDPDRVASWEASIGPAVAQLRDLGARTVSLVGLRVGAVLAARTATAVDAGALVLWDPVAGRRYARGLSVTATVQQNRAPTGAIAVDGYVVTEQTLRDLQSLSLPEPTPQIPTLALLRPGSTLDPPQPAATVMAAPEQPALFGDDTLAATVPTGSLRAMVTWLSAQTDHDQPALAVPDQPTAQVDGVRESFLTSGGLACTVTEPVAGPRTGTPTVLVVNTMVDPRLGPSRSWVLWSRELAHLGFRTVRADLSGIGDSAAPPDAGPPGPYGQRLVADIRRLITALDTGPGVAVAGLCSGARNALDAAADQPVTDLLLINPVLNDQRAVLDEVNAENRGAVDEPLQAPSRRLRHQVARRLPGPAWQLIHRLGLMDERTRSLRRALARGAQVTLVYALDDYTHIKPPANARWSFAPLLRTGRFQSLDVDSDHSLIDPIGRTNALAPLTLHLMRRYLAP